jgi:Fe-S oxidoreductase
MNPGKIVRSTRMDDATLFRYPPGYRTLPFEPALDWSAWNVNADSVADTLTPPGTGGDPAQGFGKAVEMCNNNGHCRKFDAGTMCPSFRATRDEQHLTRGRANTLRLALSGQLGTDALASNGVRDALELCVSCKGCRRECPTGVDMAKMKIEVLHHRLQVHGLARRDRWMANLPRWAPWAVRFHALANLRNRIPGAASIGERALGIAARRSLPRWRREPFLRTNEARAASARDADVVLFVDTFTNYFEPDNAHATLRVLRAAGYRVDVARALANDAEPMRPLCCGRTYLAHGMVEEAKREAQRMVAALAPLAARGIAIVGLEPACLLSLRDEYLVMGLGDDAKRLSRAALMIEEFLARDDASRRLTAVLRALPQTRALLHGHCHQKAFDVVTPALRVLGLIPGLHTELIESSCCGMAGTFGFDAAHYDVSMRMAELALLPAVRAAGDDTLIVADGTSCRHQIADGTRGPRRREPLHVVRVLDRALREPHAASH